MGLRYRSIRAGASALLVAAAVGAGGMTGMGSALAADSSTVAVSGHLVDGAGSPLAGVDLTIVEELPPDGGIAAFPLTTTDDGSFAANLYAWGTAAAPASLTISTAAGEEIDVIGDSCTRTWGVTVSDARQLALADGAPEPLTVAATTTLLGEVCGTTGTPGGGGTGGGTGAGSGSGDSGTGGGAERTPPPTDLRMTSAGFVPDRPGPALAFGVVAGLLVLAAFVLPRRRRRGLR